MNVNMYRKKINPITSKQKEILVEFISARKHMYTGKLTASYTREKMKENWVELTNILNSIPQGPAKDWKQWRKSWVDLKKNTKAKFSEEKKHVIGTGGGPPMPPTDIDTKLLSIISPVAISGNTQIEESEAEFDFEDEVNTEKESRKQEEVQTVIKDGDFVFEYVEAEQQNEGHSTPMFENNGATDGHDYRLKSTLHDNLTPKGKENINRTPQVARKKRITKSTRLQESLKNNERFLKISEENVKSEKAFREKQIYIMETDSKNKQTYYENKLIALQAIANAATQIALDVSTW